MYNKYNEDLTGEEEDDDPNEEFFEAKNYFEEDVDQMKKKLEEKKSKTESNSLAAAEKDAESSGWFGIRRTIGSVSSRFGSDNKKRKVEEMIISIKDETKRELLLEEKQKTGKEDKEEEPTEPIEKGLKLEIITDETVDESKRKRTEVTIINEDMIEIASDDIEMSALDSISFLVLLSAIFILDLFIISGVSHWIYNHLDGLDWYLKDRIHFNFHIFFMTLGICSSAIGLLVHRIFRGWSSGALNFLHTTITLTTVIFFVIGIYAVVVSLNHMNCVHFYSVHSWLGLISILSVTVLWISGIVVFVFPRFVYDMQLLLIPIHSFFGRIVFITVCATAIIGFNDKLRISDRDADIGPIAVHFPSLTNDTNITEQIKTTHWPVIQHLRETHRTWRMPGEALLLNIISFITFVFAVLVNFVSANHKYRRRLLPEEQGIDIKTRIK